MSGRRPQSASPGRPGLDAHGRPRTARLSQSTARSGKLSRSLRPTQPSPCAESAPGCKDDFKTPKRHTRIRLNGLNSADSPSHDTEDIIWDATSPTPVRKGKGAAKLSRRVVDISEIVSRIAPADERPSASECNLLQWIGDSAVPCTPEVKNHRTRRKSTRQNGVEDLMKLAKQFDINMIQQEKEQAEDQNPRAPETDTGDAGPPRGHEIDPPVLPSKLGNVGGGAAPRNTNAAQQMHLKPGEPRLESEDSLEDLFDGATQPLSGGLTPITPVQSQDRMLAPPGPPAGKAVNPVSCNPPLASSDTMDRVAKASPDFDDDWDDELLNDSFVLEMTARAPEHCSTQRDQSEKEEPGKSVQPPAAGGLHPGGDAGSAVSLPGKTEKLKNRRTFKLEANPHFQPQGKFSGTFPKGRGVGSGVPDIKTQSTLCPGHVSMVTGHQGGKIPDKRQERAPLRSSGDRETRVTLGGPRPAPSAWARDQTSVGQNSSTSEKPASTGLGCAQEVTEEDLDSFFTSDSLWGDADDDDLMYQLCSDVEKTLQSAGVPTLPGAEQCKVKPDSLLAHGDGLLTRATHTHTKSHCAFARGSVALAPPIASRYSRCQDKTIAAASKTEAASNAGPSGSGNRPYKFTRVRGAAAGAPSHGPADGPQDGGKSLSSWPASAGSAAEPRQQSSFKRHLSEPISLSAKVFVPSQVAVKCTAEEIERKKQQALARRRQRLQASQRPGAPT